MLELKIVDNYDTIKFDNKVVIDNITFVDDPNKIMIALIDILSNKKDCAVANICDDYSDNIFVFIRNTWEEKIIIIKNNETQKDEILVSQFIDIKDLAKSFVNSDLKVYIENLKKREDSIKSYSILTENYERLKKLLKKIFKEKNMDKKQKYICPICGYDGLDEPAYDENGLGSFDICPCCENEFGFDDLSCGKSIEELRTIWLKTPKGLLKRKQLKNLENPEMQSMLKKLGNREVLYKNKGKGEENYVKNIRFWVGRNQYRK